MGYYSEVALCFPQKTNNEFLVAISNQTPEIQNEINELLSHSEKYTKDKAYLYYWSWVKWYNSYPCVGFITKFLEKIDNEELGENQEYRLLTVGEHLDDNTDEGEFYDTPFNLDIVRCISYA